MSWLRACWRELVGLFVDDGRLALLTVAWLALCALGLRRLLPASDVGPWVLFGGLAVILVESAVRRARGERR